MNSEDIDKKEISDQPIKERPVLSKHFHFPRVFIILLIITVSALIFGAYGYLVGSSAETPKQNTCTPGVCPPTPTPSPICEQIPMVMCKMGAAGEVETCLQKPPI